MAQEYNWNRPESVRTDAKYRIKIKEDNYVVGMTYMSPAGEEWTPTIDKHIKLVEMVNNVKMEQNRALGGQFYINEYRQVIVPTKNGYFYTGEYHEDLIFEMEGKKISGQAIDFDGNPISIGQLWDGGLMGIPYILTAGGQDIKFKHEIRKDVYLTEKLSKYVGLADSKNLANRLCQAIGDHKGGRFYINEFREMFKPKTNSSTGEVVYIYLGKLKDDDPWFPMPKFD